MNRILALLPAGALALAALVVTASPVLAEDDEPAFITLVGGAYDVNDDEDNTAEFRLEYRSDKQFYYLKPFAAVAGTASGSVFVGAGVLMDVYFGRRLVVTPSFAPHFYHQGGSDKDLDYPLEFRSQLEIAYRFDNRSRLGLAISHYSNASLGDSNPGVETLSLNYSIPLD
ncbi:MAG: acyloxyacyl hydrolase [Rhodospirillales bacterium]